MCFVAVAAVIVGQGVLAHTGWQWRHWVWGVCTALFWLGIGGLALLNRRRWRAYAEREPGMAAVAVLGLFTAALLMVCTQGLWLGHVQEREVDTANGRALQSTLHSHIPQTRCCERYTWLVRQQDGD